MLTDAVAALPDRLRLVVIGYFFEERSMQDLADELGVSESRVSQLRAEALLLMKDGMNAHLDPDQVSDEAASQRPRRPTQGRVLRAGRHELVVPSASRRGPREGAGQGDASRPAQDRGLRSWSTGRATKMSRQTHE